MNQPTASSGLPGDNGNGLFSGLIGDFHRRKSHYTSDFTDGLHQKSIASTLFMFFACLAPAITFGGMMGLQTEGQIGAMEMLIATVGVGIVWAVFSGQPLIIMGGTGPMLVFTGILFQFCRMEGVPFLPTYAWVGLWAGLILVILSAVNASRLMGYFTRFTDEIFAGLISLIFIYESLSALAEIFINGYSGQEVNHDVPLLSLLLAIGTYQIAMSLARFRRSHYLRPVARNFLADFGPAISIVLMTAIFMWLKGLDPIQLQELVVPDRVEPTYSPGGDPRSWLVNPFTGVPAWLPWASIIPALIVVILIFLDQNITARLVNSPDNRLDKGSAYHWDLSLQGVLIGVSSLFGLPWLVAATVRSLNHVKSLASYEPVPGSTAVAARERITSVLENRVTPLAIHLMIAVSLLVLPLLKEIPMAVLFGIFLYMGVVSMSGNQFFDRLSLWFMDSELYPSNHYMRRVPMKVIHKFTAIQAFCLAVLWGVKTSVLGIVFPLFIAFLAPLRFLLARFFKEEHLEALDADEEPDEEDTRWSG